MEDDKEDDNERIEMDGIGKIKKIIHKLATTSIGRVQLYMVICFLILAEMKRNKVAEGGNCK